MTLEKVLVTENPVAGQPVEYQLILTNNGPTVAPNASFSDPIPTGATFVSFTATQGTCQLDQVEDVPAASCSLGRMAVGATATATLIVDTDPNATTISNTGFGGSGGLDEIPADNEDTATTPLAAAADLSVTKTGPAAVSGGRTGRVRHRVPQRRTVDGHRRRRHGHAARRADPATRRRLHDQRRRPCPARSRRSPPGAAGSITVIADVDPASRSAPS